MTDNINKDEKVKFNLNKSINALEEPKLDKEKIQEPDRRIFKKKTLRRITLDPPDDLDFRPEDVDIIHKPEEISRNLLYEYNNNVTSKSLIYSPSRKIKIKKICSSISINKMKKSKEKNEQNNENNSNKIENIEILKKKMKKKKI